MRKFFLLSLSLLTLLFLVVSTGDVQARHKGAVLAEATPTAEINVPATTAGPGLILPDSPLYFLDHFKQTVRLFIALSPEEKARVHAQIAGERLAELRIMLAKNNPPGISVALNELSKEHGRSAQALSDAALQGRNVSLLAKEINETLKLQRRVLETVEDQASGELKFRVKAAREALKEAKVEVEDQLPEDELEKEIKEDLESEIESEVEEAKNSAAKVERLLQKLTEEASRAAEKAMKKREEAVKKAIKEENKVLEKVSQKLKEEELEKQEKLQKIKKAAEAARQTMEEVKKTAEEIKKTTGKD